MNLIERIKRKYNYLQDKHFIAQLKKDVYESVLRSKDKNIYFFSVPLHSNLGDQAQFFCWLRYFNTNYPDYNVVCLPAAATTDETLNKIKEQTSCSDKFFIHSGYLIYDPHPELPFICKVVNTFHEHPITILPQTINLVSDKKRKEVSDCFNTHPKLTIVSRDEISLQNAKILFPKCSCALWPDVVTSLIGDPEFYDDSSKREGIMFCIRNDGEKFYSKEQIDELKKRFHKVPVVEKDTTINLSRRFWASRRERLIRETINSFSKYQLVITDRYHGTIFSQVANTPVVVLGSNDHKLVSGIKWFPKDHFSENVFFAENLETAYNLAQKILARNGKEVRNPTWFKDEFYSHSFF